MNCELLYRHKTRRIFIERPRELSSKPKPRTLKQKLSCQVRYTAVSSVAFRGSTETWVLLKFSVWKSCFCFMLLSSEEKERKKKKKKKGSPTSGKPSAFFSLWMVVGLVHVNFLASWLDPHSSTRIGRSRQCNVCRLLFWMTSLDLTSRFVAFWTNGWMLSCFECDVRLGSFFSPSPSSMFVFFFLFLIYVVFVLLLWSWMFLTILFESGSLCVHGHVCFSGKFMLWHCSVCFRLK